MLIINTLKRLHYGVKTLYKEIFNIEDYWHPKLKPIPLQRSNEVYFHDMTIKGKYPGKKVNGIPILHLNGNNPVIFHITTLNYGLGLLNRKLNGENVDYEIMSIIYWLKKNQNNDGSWRYIFNNNIKHPLADNKASGMTQGLAISFLIRCHRLGYLTQCECKKIVHKAVQFLMSKEIISYKIIDDKQIKIIEEFYSPGRAVLNGYIFSIYALYDYSNEYNNNALFLEHINYLKILLTKYKCGYWSYYDLDGNVSSKFYHKLHINMMTVLYEMTKDRIFLEYKNKWMIGIRFSLLFLFYKSFQKILQINKMPLSYISK